MSAIEIPDHSGWKARRSGTQARRAAEDAARPRRAAIALLIAQGDEQRGRENALAAAERSRDNVRSEIERATSYLATLKETSLPDAEREVEAARTHLTALVDDVERAKRILAAEAVIEATDRR